MSEERDYDRSAIGVVARAFIAEGVPTLPPRGVPSASDLAKIAVEALGLRQVGWFGYLRGMDGEPDWYDELDDADLERLDTTRPSPIVELNGVPDCEQRPVFCLGVFDSERVVA